MSKTLISWTDETLNPLVGCSKTIAKGAKESGCRLCYAETAAATPRLQQFPQYQGVIDQTKWDTSPVLLGRLWFGYLHRGF